MSDDANDQAGMPAGSTPDEVIYDPADPDRRPAWADSALEELQQSGRMPGATKSGRAEDLQAIATDTILNVMARLLDSGGLPGADDEANPPRAARTYTAEVVGAFIAKRMADERVQEIIRSVVAERLSEVKIREYAEAALDEMGWPGPEKEVPGDA